MCFYLSLLLIRVVSRIEKEIKFSPDPTALRGLVDGAPQRIQNRDVYYDFPDLQGIEYPLISQNAWLRKRNGDYELKVVQESNRQGGLKVSEEVPRDEVEGTLDDLLAHHDVEHSGLHDAGLEPLVYVNTHRRRYTQEAKTEGVEEFHVDIDRVRFWTSLDHGWERPGQPDLKWRVGEIDITATGREAAKEEIDRVVTEYDLDVHEQRKVVTYLRRTGDEIYDHVPEM